MCTATDDFGAYTTSSFQSLHVTHPACISSGVQIVSPNSPPHHKPRLFRGRKPLRGLGRSATPKLSSTLPDLTKARLDSAKAWPDDGLTTLEQNSVAVAEGWDTSALLSAGTSVDEWDSAWGSSHLHHSDGEHEVSVTHTDLLLRSPCKSQRRIKALPKVHNVGSDVSVYNSLNRSNGNFSCELNAGADVGFTVHARKAGEQKVKEILKNLGQSDLVGRWATVKTLSQITAKGDRIATEAIAAKLEHSDESVRAAAVKALTSVVEKGDVFAIDSVADRLEHPDEHVRTAAMHALPCVTSLGCVNAISSVSAKLTHHDATVRQSVAAALHFIAERGDQNVVDSISMRLEHPSEGVRDAARDALKDMSHDASTLATLLEHTNWSVRAEAVKKCGECLVKGDPLAISAILERFSNPRAAVRKAAVAAIKRVVPPDDINAIEMIVRMLEDPKAHVRSAAVDALRATVRRGDAAAIEAVSKRLEHRNVNVRSAAARTVVAIVRPGDPRAVDAVALRLGSRHEHVRLSAGKCLGRLTSRGHEIAISAVSRFLQHEDPHVRRTAVKALGDLVDKTKPSDVSLVMESFMDDDCHVRHAAISAMKSILEASANMVSTSQGVKLKGQARPTLLLRGAIDFKAVAAQPPRTTLAVVEETDSFTENANYAAAQSPIEEDNNEILAERVADYGENDYVNADIANLSSTSLNEDWIFATDEHEVCAEQDVSLPVFSPSCIEES